MKKKLSVIVTSLTLLVVMLVTLCACSSYGSIKSAFKKEGYVETELSDTYEKYVTDLMGSDYKNTVTVHCMKKESSDNDGLIGAIASSVGYVIIIEFKSDSDMAKSLKGELKNEASAEEAKEVYDELQKLDTVNQNCFLVFSVLPEGYSIFKSTK